MRKGVRKLVVSIIIAISVIIVSIPIWRVSEGNTIGLVNTRYTELPIVVKIEKLKSLLIVSDEEASTFVEPTELTLKNRNGHAKSFNLYLLVEKKSTINYQYLRVSIDDKIYKVSELKMESDYNNYYFLLDGFNTDAYETKNVDIRLWIGTEAEGLDQSSTLTTNFVIR